MFRTGDYIYWLHYKCRLGQRLHFALRLLALTLARAARRFVFRTVFAKLRGDACQHAFVEIGQFFLQDIELIADPIGLGEQRVVRVEFAFDRRQFWRRS